MALTKAQIKKFEKEESGIDGDVFAMNI